MKPNINPVNKDSIYQVEYFDKGSIGLKDYFAKRIKTVKIKNPALLIVKRDRSGNDQYLKHLSAFLEVLETVLENNSHNTENLKLMEKP